ncbi:MAG: alpha/beta fold hydrolase [Myxococcales bacterium]|nr:alpha/beta hydrolase [Myxococcales bacterium]
MTRIDGLHVSDGGSGGVPVVFLHGLGSDASCWDAQLAHFRQSRRGVAYDQRGHGESDRAREYTIASLTDDLDRVTSDLGLTRFWLVGHSFSGLILSSYAGRHPEKLAGLVYVDAVGDLSGFPREVKDRFRKLDEGMTPQRLQEEYGKMLGPKAKPETRRQVLASAARLDLPEFASLRGQMGDFQAKEAVARFSGPKYAIEAEGAEENPWTASRLPGVQRRPSIPGVSHWLMLDDPAALNAALDEVLK